MRFARFAGVDGSPRVGVVDGEELVPLAPHADLLELLVAEPHERVEGVAALVDGEPLPLRAARLLAPIEPRSIRDFVTFEEHVEGIVRSGGPDAEVAAEWYDAPTFYFTNAAAVTGPFDEVPVPPGCTLLDFELEVAAVVGRAGTNLTADEAGEHIVAYTIFNDWSARDLQRREMRVLLGPAKGKDFASTLGPVLVTADELDPYRRDGRLHLELEAFVNGAKIGDDTLASMAWSFEEMLAYASRGTRVLPGDVLGSGTCGAGCLAELWGRRGRLDPPPLAPGDVVTLEVEALGTLENRVVAGSDAPAIPRARLSRRRSRVH